jgi:hypothetical protein
MSLCAAYNILSNQFVAFIISLNDAYWAIWNSFRNIRRFISFACISESTTKARDLTQIMKHHFGDFLDRTGDYWTIVPNRERYAYAADLDIADKEAVKILTISKHHHNWKQVFDCPNLEESHCTTQAKNKFKSHLNWHNLKD